MQRRHPGRIGHIPGRHDHSPRMPRRQRLKPIHGPRGDRHRPAARHQRLRNRRPDAGRSPCDPGDAILRCRCFHRSQLLINDGNPAFAEHQPDPLPRLIIPKIKRQIARQPIMPRHQRPA